MWKNAAQIKTTLIHMTFAKNVSQKTLYFSEFTPTKIILMGHQRGLDQDKSICGEIN